MRPELTRTTTHADRLSYAALSATDRQAVDMWTDGRIAWDDVPQGARTFIAYDPAPKRDPQQVLDEARYYAAHRDDLIAVEFTTEGEDLAAHVHMEHVGATVTLRSGATIPLMLPPGQEFDLEIRVDAHRRTVRLVARAGETCSVESRSALSDRFLAGVRVAGAARVSRPGADAAAERSRIRAAYDAIYGADLTNRHPEGLEGER